MTDDRSFLQQYGGLTRNSLVEILNNHESEIEENELETINHSSYYDLTTFFDEFEKNSENFSIFSTNIESINAKFNELVIFLHMLREKGFKFSAICLQECWLSENFNMSLLHLDGYHCFFSIKRMLH